MYLIGIETTDSIKEADGLLSLTVENMRFSATLSALFNVYSDTMCRLPLSISSEFNVPKLKRYMIKSLGITESNMGVISSDVLLKLPYRSKIRKYNMTEVAMTIDNFEGVDVTTAEDDVTQIRVLLEQAIGLIHEKYDRVLFIYADIYDHNVMASGVLK